MDGLPFRHQGEYETYQQAMVGSSLHMAQMPSLPAALNLSVNNQGGYNSGSPAYHYSYGGSLGANMVGQQGAHMGAGGKAKKKFKLNKDGVPPPKRATTAYIHFTQWYREELKRSGREIPKIGEFGKECAGKWNAMNEEQREPFLDSAARDRERYKREMSIYKPARDANKPKRPGTAFMIFMADFRKEMAGKEPEGGVAAMAKLGGERWRGMSDDEKQPYVEQQLEAKLRYEHSMEEYRRTQNLEAQKARAEAVQQQQQHHQDVEEQQEDGSQNSNNFAVGSPQGSACSTPASSPAPPTAQDLSASTAISCAATSSPPLPSFSTSLALGLPSSYGQYSLPNFTNYTQAHSNSSYQQQQQQQPPQDPYRWN